MNFMEKVYRDEDFCDECSEFWKAKGRPPMLFVLLPNTTMRNDLEVRVCPFCDGGVVSIAGVSYE